MAPPAFSTSSSPSAAAVASTAATAIAALLFPRNPPIVTVSPQKPQHKQRAQRSLPRIRTSRRDAALLSFLGLATSLCRPAAASALTIGISGPKDWLREQKRKASKFLLAPIDASRESLRTAYLLLTSNPDDMNKHLEEVRKLLRSATRDCLPQERDPFVAFQASTGVEVCTFQLIVKNASSLLDNNDPTKLEAEAMLNDLIRSLASLSAEANEADFQVASNRQKVVDALAASILTLNKFEQGIKDCLEV